MTRAETRVLGWRAIQWDAEMQRTFDARLLFPNSASKLRASDHEEV